MSRTPGLAPLLPSLLLWAVSPLQAQTSGEITPAPADPGIQPSQTNEYPPDAGPGGTSGHVAPDPPSQPLSSSMGGNRAHMMDTDMNDAGATGQLLIDQLEWVHTHDEDSGAWKAEGWYGNDYNKLWIKTEGEFSGDSPPDARLELLGDRIISRWWSVQAGVRLDVDNLSRVMGGSIPTRAWAAFGVQGGTPAWFDVEATIYVSDGGHAGARLKTKYELLLTQRLILEPEIEADFETRADPARLVGSGLTDVHAGLRLRYEIWRQLAPYIGIAGHWHVGATANRVSAAGYDTDERGLVIGIRAWF